MSPSRAVFFYFEAAASRTVCWWQPQNSEINFCRRGHICGRVEMGGGGHRGTDDVYLRRRLSSLPRWGKEKGAEDRQGRKSNNRACRGDTRRVPRGPEVRNPQREAI